jgi:hypothetical protein
VLRLPKYMLAYNREELPAPVVISSRPPYIVGQIWKFKDHMEYIEFINQYKGLGIAPVTGYKIAITFGGVMTGTRMQVPSLNVKDEIDRVLQEMVTFFIKEQVEDKPGIYRKFLLIQ